ncbi:hypothetical protein OOT00_06915 [Desulfobotulus sp. H1]|uniref:PEGA domain-containing protein n=1 Tax=Desulfobotulus pelophilus TaxID=2823377 RepID=A0ABT3N8C8_9BACT|nr:hypothetical protein [Desulfobotulus pelophilus]MCW7753713.1 hypothetical protein [Desulfobotulus pelophilus]
MFRKSFFCLILSGMFLVVLSQSTDAARNECWESCAPTMEEARESIASQIFVNVQSATFIRQSKRDTDKGISFLSGWFSSSEVQSEASFESRQQVNMTLVNARVITQQESDQGVCLQVCREDLIAYTDELIEKTKTYQPHNLPADERLKKQTLNTWIGDIETAKSLATIFGNSLREKAPHGRLLKQEKELKDLSADLYEQSLTITSTIPDAVLILNGSPADIGEKIFLPEGVHKYLVTASGHCEVSGTADLQQYKDQTLRIHPKPYPTVTVTSNQPGASLQISGAPWPLGKEKVMERCEGSVPYVVSYGGETKTGSFRLSPGVKASDKAYLFTDKEVQRLKEMSSVFTTGTSLELGYIFSVPGSDFSDLHNVHKISLAYYKNHAFFRFGLGAAYGRGDTIDESFTVDAWLSMILQLSELGGRERPLHFFGFFPIIPFAGLDVGLGYHDIYNTRTRQSTDSFPTSVASEKNDFFRDHGLLRTTAGLQVPVNKHLGIRCFYAKNFSMEKASEFAMSLVIGF